MSDPRFTILITGSADRNLFPENLPENISIDIIPFIRTMPLPAAQIGASVFLLGQRPLTVVFTSAEAVRAVQAFAGMPAAWKCYCTSGGTEKLLREWLGDAAIAGSARDAATLAGRINSAHERQLTFFCGNHRRDVLPERLRAAGIGLEEVFVYDTAETQVRLNRDYDAVLFFSPSAVSSFFSVNLLPPQTAVFALGDTTAEALRRHIRGTVYISEQPDKISLLRKAVEYGLANMTL